MHYKASEIWHICMALRSKILSLKEKASPNNQNPKTEFHCIPPCGEQGLDSLSLECFDSQRLLQFTKAQWRMCTNRKQVTFMYCLNDMHRELHMKLSKGFCIVICNWVHAPFNPQEPEHTNALHQRSLHKP